MTVREVNFDGLVGPTHNYAGLSLGNLAAASNEGRVSHPRAAALQGLAKIRRLMDLGLVQGIFPPPPRPSVSPLRGVGFGGDDAAVLAQAAREEPEIFQWACAASSMWTANAATVIAAPDTADGRTHLVTANLGAMPHRSFEATDTYKMLRSIFADPDDFAVHAPLPHAQHFGDEGAANHMRLASSHAEPGVNVFVHGAPRGSRYPERQARRASAAVARIAGVTDPVFALQAQAALEAGAFHNDVVAVANEGVLFAHATAFDDAPALMAALEARAPDFQPIVVDALTLEEAISSYLFNSQLVTLPGRRMALIAPSEVRDNPRVWAELGRIIAANNPIDQVIVVDVRESMRNGGGPACLRLRAPLSQAALAAVDQRYILDDARWTRIVRAVEASWPEAITPPDLFDPQLWEQSFAASKALRQAMDL
jgi:succinylarginine dihydrolase